ncbi:hypothetical protein BKA67DRAFT_513754 [Truncatella angustata]|uniref:Methyltransferase domain-containing protein n=1 Tax=Truncatella angustata TaxID=152316 RepID=A0A9P8UT93_9PEZI|nr:uncharacterized protein BKA67DRAFT_513754 [Truncatella angustata]KAH6658077.1 hypothetical protein BKA67DRAFT_513754 [Truncatella angustata]
MLKEKRSWDIAELRAQLYWEVLPADIGPIRQLLENYSGVPPAEVDAHILAIRERLWQIKPYGCIGKFRFLQLDFTSDPRYQQALALLKRRFSRDTLLDLGCCVGQVLRQLVDDGACSSRLFGADLEPRFVEIGYELFRDRKKLKSMFVAGDVLAGSEDDSPTRDPLKLLDGKMTVVHATSFFHLFGWNDQIRAARRIIRLLKPKDANVFIFGRQVGCVDPGNQPGPKGYQRFLHNAESWQSMWDQVGEQTGTRWRAEMDIIPDSHNSGLIGADVYPEGFNRIRFGVHRA